MKKLLMGAFALILIAGAAQAQDNGNQKQGTHHFQKLNLTDAQKAQLKTLHEKERSELQALDKNDQMIVRDWKAKKKEIHERYKTQFESVFTPEQKTQITKMREGRKDGRFGQAFKGRGGKGMRPGGFAKDLNLTQAQQEKMKDLRTQFKSKADAIKGNKDLTQDQRKTQFRDLMKDQREQMKNVLTPEQMEKIQSHMKERRNRDTK